MPLLKHTGFLVKVVMLSDSEWDDQYCEQKGTKNSQGLTSYQR